MKKVSPKKLLLIYQPTVKYSVQLQKPLQSLPLIVLDDLLGMTKQAKDQQLIHKKINPYELFADPAH